MISRELSSQQEQEWKQMIIPDAGRKIVVEADISLGWEMFTKNSDDLFTLNQFGLSGTGTEVADFFKFNVENLVNKMRSS